MTDILVRLEDNDQVREALAEWEISVLKAHPHYAFLMTTETAGPVEDGLVTTVRYSVEPQFLDFLSSRKIPFKPM